MKNKIHFKYSKIIMQLFLLIILITNNCAKKTEVWYCPMHTTYTSDHAGQCPICNMDLIKKENHFSHENQIESKENHSINSKTENNSIILTQEKQDLIGIKVSKAEYRNLSKTITAYSRVAYDPDLYTAILEYKEAKNISSELDKSLVNSSILRLKQLGLSNSEISEWGNSNRNPDELILGGKKGKAIIYSSIFESDIQYIKPFQKVVFKTDSYSDKIFLGKIQSIDSIVEEKNRTLRFRSFVFDKENILKPQMFGNIEIEIPLKKALTIPKSAILNTGKHKLVYIKKFEKEFYSVIVKTGIESNEYFEILEGVMEGDLVVTESNFLLDSESKIKLGDKNEQEH